MSLHLEKSYLSNQVLGWHQQSFQQELLSQKHSAPRSSVTIPQKELVLGELKQGLSMWAHKIDYLEYLHYVDAKFLFLQEQILFWCRGEGKPWILRAVTDFWSGHALLWSSVKTNQNKGVVDVNVKTDPKTSECICRRALEVEMCRNYIIAKEQRQNGNKMCAAGSQSTCENIWTKSDKSIITLWMLL